MPWRVLVVSSSGGVLLDALHLKPWLERHDVQWVAVRAADTEVLLQGQRVRWQGEAVSGALWRLPGAVARAFTTLRADQPDVVVSAGTGIAVGYFLAARVLRIPTVWLDTFNVVARPGRASRLCGALASLRLVQRPSLAAAIPGSVCIGELY